MKPTPLFSIPNPCHENWEQMSPAERGRHCAVCDKVVQDFTAKTDEEILAYFQSTNEKVCGRFRNDQLALPPPERMSAWKRFVAALFIAFSGWLLPGCSQKNVRDLQSQIYESRMTTGDTTWIQPAYRIRPTVKVLNARNNEPVNTAEVSIERNNFFDTKLNKVGQGLYALETEIDSLTEYTQVIVTAPGFSPRNDAILPRQLAESPNEPVLFKLEPLR